MVKFIVLGFTASIFAHGAVHAQGFDPSKVRVAKDKAAQLQVYQNNIQQNNNFNKTLNTPDHPRPQNRLFQTMDKLAEDNARMQQELQQMKATITELSTPSNNTPNYTSPQSPNRTGNPGVPQFESGPNQPYVFVAKAKDKPLRNRNKKKQVPAELPTFDDEGVAFDPTAPILDTTVVGQTDRVAELENKIAELELTLAGNRPPREAAPAGFRKLFGKKKVQDVPAQPIPIEISRTHPYDEPGFVAGPEHSSLFDIHPSEQVLRDLTSPSSLPVPQSGTSNLSSTETVEIDVDTSVYYLVTREGSMFTPFSEGTTTPEPDYGFEMYSGAIVKTSGLQGTKRIVMIDSGEIGVMSKSDIRSLTSSEKATMEKGLKARKQWYSILDTEPTS